MVLHVASSSSSVFISRFTLTASEYEAVTADDGYKVHSPLSMNENRNSGEWAGCARLLWRGG